MNISAEKPRATSPDGLTVSRLLVGNIQYSNSSWLQLLLPAYRRLDPHVGDTTRVPQTPHCARTTPRPTAVVPASRRGGCKFPEPVASSLSQRFYIAPRPTSSPPAHIPESPTSSSSPGRHQHIHATIRCPGNLSELRALVRQASHVHRSSQCGLLRPPPGALRLHSGASRSPILSCAHGWRAWAPPPG